MFSSVFTYADLTPEVGRVVRKNTKFCQRRMYMDGPYPRAVARGGGLGGLKPPQFLTDQLTLSQSGGHIMPTTLLRAPPRIFRPCDGPV